MALFSWLRRHHRPRTIQHTRRFRPALEMLEDRLAPATLNVNTTLDILRTKPDNGVLSLRQAIIDANKTSEADTIVLPAGAYNLTRAGALEDNGSTGDLDIKAPLTIAGAGAGSTIVDAKSLDRVFQVFNVDATFSGMTIRGGNASASGGKSNESAFGGGIYSAYPYGALKITDCVISGNRAQNGGGIFNGGGQAVHTITNCEVSGNTAAMSANSGDGGGIYNTGTLTITGSSFTGNSANGRGGAIYEISSYSTVTLTIQSSTLSRNHAVNLGGGLYDYGSFSVSIQSTKISDNTAESGGGVYSFLLSGKLTIADSDFDHNAAGVIGDSYARGGGLYNAGSATITDCEFTHNSANKGGGIFHYDAGLAVSNCQFTDNSAFQGGGIYNIALYKQVTVTSCTFKDNSASDSGGGIYNAAGAKLNIVTSTFLNNLAPLGADLYRLGTVTIDADTTIGDIDP